MREAPIRILIAAAAHLAVAMAIAMLAFGADMDQLRSRSPASRSAAEIHDVLWFPHDTAMRAIPNVWLVRNKWVIPLAIVVNSLLWGTVLYAVWRVMSRRAPG